MAATAPRLAAIGRRDGAILLFTAVPRLAYLVQARPPFMGSYWVLAGYLLRTGSLGIDGARTTEFEPGYPVFLAAARLLTRDHPFGVQLIQIALSSIGALLLYRLARLLTGSSRIAMIAAVLYAGDLLLIKQAAGESPFVLVTTLLIAFAYAVVNTASATGAIYLGGIFGVLMLTRAMTLPLAACMAIALAVRGRRRDAAIAVIAAVLVVFPWSARSFAVNGSLWPTRSGLNLFLGTLPAARQMLPDYDIDLLEPVADRAIREDLTRPDDGSPESLHEIDTILTRRAIANLSRHPLRTLKGRAIYLVRYFWPPIVPYYLPGPDTQVAADANGIVVLNAVRRSRIEIVAYSVLYTVVLAGAVIGAVIRRGALLRRDVILICILMTFALVHTVYFPATRYRGPVSFVLLFYAAVACDWAVTVRLKPDTTYPRSG